jgi:pilus assembly protein Flp/PilA
MLSPFARVLGRFAADESGATAIEYGLIVSLIFLVILASVESVASGTTSMFATLASAMS